MNKFLVRGLGFFNDAYDLFIMNIINVVLEEAYGKDVYTSSMKSAVSAAVFIGAVIGQLVFGYLGDVFGRKVNMIATCVLLICGGILCACAYGGSPHGTLWFLVIARGVLGIGIGGEYPLAASSTAEDASSVEDRNRRVAMTFSLQGIGSVFAAILGNLLVQMFANGDAGTYKSSHLQMVWRLLFAVGVIPAIVVCYYRVFAEETEAFKAAQQRGQVNANEAGVGGGMAHKRARLSFIVRHYGRGLIGCASTWFLFDIVFYAQNLFSASILSVIGVSDPSLQQVTMQNVWVALLALPGYYVAIAFINKLGRKRMQLQGFFFMFMLFVLLASLWKEVKQQAIVFILMYGLALFFANFGPNTCTFVLPTEMFPTAIRGTCHGISAACGKAGAAVGAFGFSIWVEMDGFGYEGAFFTFAGICLVSLPLTWFCLFDNNTDVETMDLQFEALLADENALTRESFVSNAVIHAKDVTLDTKFVSMESPVARKWSCQEQAV